MVTDHYEKLRAALDAQAKGGSAGYERYLDKANPATIRALLADYDEAERALTLSGKVGADLMETVMELTAERDKLRDMLIAVVRELDDRRASKSGDDAPGHSHDVPGVWDSDNGDLAGKPCAWCALWREAKALAQEQGESDGKGIWAGRCGAGLLGGPRSWIYRRRHTGLLRLHALAHAEE